MMNDLYEKIPGEIMKILNDFKNWDSEIAMNPVCAYCNEPILNGPVTVFSNDGEFSISFHVECMERARKLEVKIKAFHDLIINKHGNEIVVKEMVKLLKVKEEIQAGKRYCKEIKQDVPLIRCHFCLFGHMTKCHFPYYCNDCDCDKLL